MGNTLNASRYVLLCYSHFAFLVVRNYHKGVKYECGTCQKQFNSKDHLELHHKTLEHSGEVVIELSADVKKCEVTDENNLHCEKCEKEFSSKEDYEVLIRRSPIIHFLPVMYLVS